LWCSLSLENGDEHSPQTLQDMKVIRRWDKFTTLFFYIDNDAVHTCAACCSVQKHNRQATSLIFQCEHIIRHMIIEILIYLKKMS